MLAVYKKELRGYLTSMIGYVFVAFILLILGIYFTAYNLQYASPDFGATLNSVTFIFLIITPILTMKILAEEKKNKTDQLLLTAPVSVWKVVLGKYLSMVTMYLIPVVIAGFYPLIMGRYGTVSYAMAYTALLGFFFLGCAQIAVGMFLSSVTESQVIAAVLTFGVLFCSFMMDGITSFFSDTAITSMMAFLVLVIILGVIIYQMTKSVVLSAGVSGVLAVVTLVVYIIETKNPVFTVLKRQRCRNAQEVNDISTPFYTPFRPVVRYSNYQGCFLRLNPGWGQETNIDPDN